MATKIPLVVLGALTTTALTASVGCGRVSGDSDLLGDGGGTTDSGPPDSGSPDTGSIDSGSVPVIDGGSIDGGPGCSQCPFGCDPDSSPGVCLPAKLWVYPTTGLYVGNGFGGQENAVRATGDLLCAGTADARYADRLCNRDRTRAVLFVSDEDSIPDMATRYGIPTDAPVHRADDDVRVFAGWNDLVDTSNTRSPAAPVTLATPGFVWSGALGTATCQSWTSAASAQLGNQGDTTLTSANWLSRRAIGCDQLAHLLCICWSGGE